MLPIIRPTIVVAALLRLIESIKAFPLIFIMTNGGPGIATQPTNYYAYLQAFSYTFIGYSSAVIVLILLIYSSTGILDTRPGLIIIYLTFNLSLVVWMMRSFFEAMPSALEEASFIIAAGGVLIMLPVLIFAIAVRRYLVRGLAAGAIKG